MTDQQRQAAIRRIRAKRDFRLHVAAYVAVNALLVVIWALTSPGYFWPVWPMLGWGIAVALHGVRAYLGTSPITESHIERELDRVGS